MLLDGRPFKFNMDTGAQVKVISYDDYLKVSSKPLQCSRAKLISYSGHTMEVAGKYTGQLEFKGRYHIATFEVIYKTIRL